MTTTPITSNAEAAKTPSDRDRKWMRTKQIGIWIPQGVSLAVVIALLPCDHPFRFWRRWIPDFLDFSKLASVSASPFVVNSVMYVSLFATVILILIGTWEFLNEAKSTRNDGYSRWAVRLTRVSLGLGVVWALSILTTDQRFWFIERLGIEVWSLAIFLIFAVIDSLYWFSFKNQLGSKHGPEKRSTELKKAFSANSFWLIDAPVIIGVICVLLLTLYMTNEPRLRELTDAGNELFKPNKLVQSHKDTMFETFLHGFSTGAIVMHVAFSQFIFGILKTRDLRKRFEEGLAGDLYV